MTGYQAFVVAAIIFSIFVLIVLAENLSNLCDSVRDIHDWLEQDRLERDKFKSPDSLE